MASSQILLKYFNPVEEEWEIYKERLENHFKLTKTKDEEKVAMLIGCLQSNEYQVMRDICTP